MTTHADAETLSRVNAELHTLLRKPPAPLLTQRAPDADPLVVCGIVGAKDTGKSTLIDALTRRRVAGPEDEVGEGTRGVVAYVHSARRDDFNARLRAADAGITPERIVTHDSHDAENLVLLDLPDISSTFEDHARTVRAVVPILDRVVWLWDPMLAGDRSYLQRAGRVVMGARNVRYVLNKADLLLRDDAPPGTPPDELWRQWREWFRSAAAVPDNVNGNGNGNGRAHRHDDAWYMVAAAYPDPRSFTHAAMRALGQTQPETRTVKAAPIVERIAQLAAQSLDRLREDLLSPVSPDRAAAIKSENLAARIEADRKALLEHYELETLAQLSAEAARAAAEETERAFDDRFCASLGRKLARRAESEAELAAEVASLRLQHWPILPAVYWAVRAPLLWLRRRIADDAPDSTRWNARDARIDGVTLEARAERAVNATRARAAPLLDRLSDPDILPDPQRIAHDLAARADDATDDLRARVITHCTPRRSRPGTLGLLFVYGSLLWFPFIQPVTHGLLLLLSGGAAETVRGAAVVVGALGALSILKGLAVVLVLYALAVAAVFASSIRCVRAAVGTNSGEPDAYTAEVARAVEEEAAAPLRQPLEHLAQRLRAARDALKAPTRA